MAPALDVVTMPVLTQKENEFCDLSQTVEGLLIFARATPLEGGSGR